MAEEKNRENADHETGAEVDEDRRHFLRGASRVAMATGLVGSYGAFGLIGGRYLYPAQPDERQWQFVAEASRLGEGETLLYRAPSGETINVTRQVDAGGEASYIALSSTCPHLGCQVHWEPQNERYFCPCHNGTFDPQGQATGGPPAEANQVLPRYPIKAEGGLLFIEVPVTRLAGGADEDAARGEILEEPPSKSAPGHDPCLGCSGDDRFARRS